MEKREIEFGQTISLAISGLKILAVGGMLQIKQRGRKGRYITRGDDAERFVKSIRSAVREGIRDLQNQKNPAVSGIKFPLDGKLCQIRVNVYLGYSPDDSKALALQDVDNVLKGVYDGLKEGPIYPVGTWGFIDDDRYIVGGYNEKGEAPDNGQGSRILIRITRARIRTALEMSHLVKMGIPIFPPFRASDQSPIIIPNKIIIPS